MISEQVALRIERAEAQAYADFWRAASTLSGVYGATRVHEVAGAVVGVMPGIHDPYPMWELIFNSVIGLGVFQPVTEAEVDQIVRYYRDVSIRFSVRLSPHAQPPALRDWLLARGLHVKLNLYKCFRATDSPPELPTDFRIEEIGEEHKTAFTALAAPIEYLRPPVAALVGRSGWRHYLAFAGDQAVACGSLYVQDQAGWLGFAFTNETHRNRGAQSALLARRIADAADMGCLYLTAETGVETLGQPNPSYHNILRAGFELAEERFVFVS